MSWRLTGAFSQVGTPPRFVKCGSPIQTFWRRLLLQISYREIALQHLIVALSALDQSSIRNYSDPHESLMRQTAFEFCLKQYNLGMKSLHSNFVRLDYAVLLAAHLLIAFLEKWLNEHQNAERSSLAVARILRPVSSFELDDPEFILRTLERLVRRELAEFACFSENDLSFTYRTIFSNAESPMGQCNSAEEAAQQLQDISDHILSSYRDQTTQRPYVSMPQLIRNARNYLHKWYRRFCNLRTHVLRSGDAIEVRNILFIDMKCSVLEFACMTCLFSRQHYPRRCTEIFEDLLVICKKLLDTEKQLVSHTSNAITRSFAPDSGIVICLHMVALLSTSSNIRRQAIQLSYRAKKVEGNFASDALGVVSEHVMQIEEGRIGDDNSRRDVPLQNQVQLLSTNYQTLRAPGSNTTFVQQCGVPQPNLPSYDVNISGDLYARIEFDWFRLADQQKRVQKSLVVLVKYESRSVVRSRCAHWWPIGSSFPLLEDELDYENRARDGPHLGFDSFQDVYDFSFPSICNLTILRTGGRKSLVSDTSTAPAW